MGKILEGKPVAEAIFADLEPRVQALKSVGAEPALMIIRVGEREDDKWYERSIIRNCEKAGIRAVSQVLAQDVSENGLLGIIENANKNAAIHGIMLLKPFPRHISEEAVARTLSPEKDVDCISEANVTKVFTGGATVYPCTPQAVVTLLKHYGIPLAGKRVVVCGRGMVVGKPLAMLLLSENATVTVCHSKTQDIAWHTKNADIAVAAIGKARFFGREHFTEESIIVDVGVNTDENGKLCGDVDYEGVVDFVSAATPYSGGVGAVTTAILLSNAVKSCENLTNIGRNN